MRSSIFDVLPALNWLTLSNVVLSQSPYTWSTHRRPLRPIVFIAPWELRDSAHEDGGAASSG